MMSPPGGHSSGPPRHSPVDIAAEVAAISGIKGCAYCGGLGHRVTECPKLNSVNERAAKGARDFFGADGFGGET